MKSSAFADRLNEAAAMFDAAHATKEANALRSIAPVFKALPAKTATDVIKKLSEADFPSATFMQVRMDVIASALPPLEQFVASIATKAIAADFTAFTTLIEKHKNTGIEQFVVKATEVLSAPTVGKAKPVKTPKILRSDLVERYNKRLEDALGDDPGFRQIIVQLQNDTEMTSGEMTALAKRFAFASVKSRDQAVKKILSRHQDLMISRAASRATAGRIAG
jgi:hypothetical protein